MKTSFRFVVAAGILLCTVVEAAAAEYARPFPVVGIPKGASTEQRAVAERLGREFGITVSELDTNPVCCVWLELRAWRPKPGTDGYVIIHHSGGTLITASSQRQLDAAVERFIKSSRMRDGKREAPVGLMTSYEVVK
jgi:hypothetical protein